MVLMSCCCKSKLFCRFVLIPVNLPSLAHSFLRASIKRVWGGGLHVVCRVWKLPHCVQPTLIHAAADVCVCSIFLARMSSVSCAAAGSLFKCIHILEHFHLDGSHRGPGGFISAADITKPNEQPQSWLSSDTSASVWVQSAASPQQEVTSLSVQWTNTCVLNDLHWTQMRTLKPVCENMRPDAGGTKWRANVFVHRGAVIVVCWALNCSERWCPKNAPKFCHWEGCDQRQRGALWRTLRCVLTESAVIY